MEPAQLSRELAEREPHQVWNQFLAFLVTAQYSRLSPLQRIAWLASQYESEVLNGGHLQYFENCGTERLPDTLTALQELGAQSQTQVLADASALYRSKDRLRAKSVAEYCSEALKGEFEDLDERYGHCSPTLTEKLEAYLAQHRDEFVVLV